MAPHVRTFHLLVSKQWKLFRIAAQNASKFIQSKVPASLTRPAAELKPIYARLAPRHPVHPAAFLKQSKRWSSTTHGIASGARQFTTGASKGKPAFRPRATFPSSKVASAIGLSTGRTPFASTLRPHLTGGTLGRTAGGYSMGGGRVGGARFFSHGPAAPAQIIQNVNQAIRAFAVGGKKAQFDGTNPKTGEKRYKTVTVLQHEAAKQILAVPKATPGSFIGFSVNPSITALTPLNAIPGFQTSQRRTETLNTEGLLDVLSIDFSRALKDLAVILNDLKRLSALGDLPITYQDSSIRIHFPGCDSDTVERLADELGIQRGIVRQDEDFDAYNGTDIALLFPFAASQTPSECSFYEKSVTNRKVKPQDRWWGENALIDDAPATPIVQITPDDFSTLSDSGMELDGFEEEENPWLSSPSGYESLHSSELDDSGRCYEKESHTSPLEYSGIAGIYRFISEIDTAAGRTQ
ncbi:hypothetical protein EG328_011820 [Venturia inaequalis]|uniref:Casein kinase II beta 2 subunit n=1 Tax=Venturia inaequalis TaxID=5025 RepID=A0A8H3V1H9_VENIN|nr:hypothetical protein EG327_006626 [Venturia inaequalis]KAE9981145.1 hypothetical protein EG328_011820 [Venturia inaequalis]